jgi:hypothetical protein
MAQIWVLDLQSPSGPPLRFEIWIPAFAGTSGSRKAQLLGVSDPVPFGVLMVTQVPFGTSFQALPS